MPKLLELSGKKYGRLLAISKIPNSYNGRTMWKCLCDCGNYATVSTKSLRNGDTKSCGCLSIERAMEHVRRNEKPIGYKRIHKQNGRVEVKTDRGFVYEHVYLMEQKIGRRLKKNEVVHHIDHDKTNNDINNLQLMTQSSHTTYHNTHKGYKHVK